MKRGWAWVLFVSIATASCASVARPGDDAGLALDSALSTDLDAAVPEGDASSDERDTDTIFDSNRDGDDVVRFDARENDGASAARDSRGCVRETFRAWAVGTSVLTTTADGVCPTSVLVTARGSPYDAMFCGEIAPCCDYFARCEFEVVFEVVHRGRDFECPAPSRSVLRSCRCLGNRVSCDYDMQHCPAELPSGWTCNATPGSRVFEFGLCSDCTVVRDGGLDP